MIGAALFLSVCVAVLLYLAGAFISWQWHPHEWSEFARALIVGLWIILTVAVLNFASSVAANRRRGRG